MCNKSNVKILITFVLIKTQATYEMKDIDIPAKTPSKEELENFVFRVLSHKSYSDVQKIDSLLELNANMYANLGSDSKKGEVDDVKRKTRVIYRAIKSIDERQGSLMLRTQDKQ